MGWMVLFLGKISRDHLAKFHAPPSSKNRRSLYARWSWRCLPDPITVLDIQAPWLKRKYFICYFALKKISSGPLWRLIL